MGSGNVQSQFKIVRVLRKLIFWKKIQRGWAWGWDLLQGEVAIIVML